MSTPKEILLYCNKTNPISPKVAEILERIFPVFYSRIAGAEMSLTALDFDSQIRNADQLIFLVTAEDFNISGIREMINKSPKGAVFFIKTGEATLPTLPNEIKVIINLVNTSADALSKEQFPQEIISAIVDYLYRISQIEVVKSDNKNIVFVAETTLSQEPSRQELIRELTDFGYRVVPESMLPRDANQLKAYLEKEISKAELFIHLIGNEYGPMIPGASVSMIELQHQMVNTYLTGKQNGPDYLCRYIWITPFLKPASKEQATFISNLQQDSDQLIRTEIIQTPLEKFKSIILDRLNESDFAKTAKSSDGKKQKKIYHIYDAFDEKLLKPIHEQLQKSGFEVLQMDKSLRQNSLDVHREYLSECDAILVNFSGTNEQWLSSKLKDVVKAPGYGRKGPYMGVGLILNKETNIRIERYLSDITIIKQENAAEPVMLDSFLQKMNKK